ncbi:hypothetical protein A2U01_0101489 [Trifolium medium]|uniref:Uncharacterized protein n=1 Tax=Trifolium medium TaxID=97028 RepID=A0A392UW37_9FABA|nr:hypothetical protein [Trifolium medium]
MNIAPEAKGKEIEAEHHPLVLALQEKLEAQGAEQEKIKEELNSLSEGQQNIVRTQDDISTKLSAILAHLANYP